MLLRIHSLSCFLRKVFWRITLLCFVLLAPQNHIYCIWLDENYLRRFGKFYRWQWRYLFHHYVCNWHLIFSKERDIGTGLISKPHFSLLHNKKLPNCKLSENLVWFILASTCLFPVTVANAILGGIIAKMMRLATVGWKTLFLNCRIWKINHMSSWKDTSLTESNGMWLIIELWASGSKAIFDSLKRNIS